MGYDPSTDDNKDREQTIPPIGMPMFPVASRPTAMPTAQPNVPMPVQPAPQQAQQPAITLPTPQKPAIERLMDKAKGIDNPFARILAETGTGILRTAEGIAEGAFPREAMFVPGSITNTTLQNKTAMERAKEQSVMQTAQGEDDLRKAQADEARARTKQIETGKPETPKTENLQQGYADAIRDALANGRDPNTDPHVQAWKAAIAGEQKPKEPKHSPGEIKLDEGIPTGVYGEGDKLWRANDPNMPPDLKAALGDAQTAHKQKVQEGLNQAAAGRSVLAGSKAINVMTGDGQIVGVDGLELSQFLKDNPGSVIVGSGAPTQAMGKQALIGDIRQSAENVSKNLDVLDRKGFDYAKLAAALADPNTTAEAYLQAIPRGSLDDKAQQFVSDLFNLREQAMAMRSVLGAGQGSEDMRRAILQTLPGISSGSKGFGKKQIDNLLGVLGRLEKGVPSVPMRGGSSDNTTQKKSSFKDF